MRRIIILFTLILLNVPFAQAGQQEKWINSLENPKWDIDRLKPDNFISKYIHYDFSSLLMPKKNFMGYIGTNYRRLKIKFISVSKNPDDQAKYMVRGYSIVKKKCDFEGSLEITQIREYEKMHYGADDEYKDQGIKSQGLLLAKYIFNENKEQKYSGTFKGIMTLFWYVDKSGNIKYDDIESFSDNYVNNQYVGTWSQYGRTTEKVANWGEYRVPFPGDLDIGAGEFGVNPKYYKQGWQDYQ